MRSFGMKGAAGLCLLLAIFRTAAFGESFTVPFSWNLYLASSSTTSAEGLDANPDGTAAAAAGNPARYSPQLTGGAKDETTVSPAGPWPSGSLRITQVLCIFALLFWAGIIHAAYRASGRKEAISVLFKLTFGSYMLALGLVWILEEAAVSSSITLPLLPVCALGAPFIVTAYAGQTVKRTLVFFGIWKVVIQVSKFLGAWAFKTYIVCLIAGMAYGLEQVVEFAVRRGRTGSFQEALVSTFARSGATSDQLIWLFLFSCALIALVGEVLHRRGTRLRADSVKNGMTIAKWPKLSERKQLEATMLFLQTEYGETVLAAEGDERDELHCGMVLLAVEEAITGEIDRCLMEGKNDMLFREAALVATEAGLRVLSQRHGLNPELWEGWLVPDMKIIGDYGGLLGTGEDSRMLLPLSMLPYPKAKIEHALKTGLKLAKTEAMRDSLESVLLRLDDFVPDAEVPRARDENVREWFRHKNWSDPRLTKYVLIGVRRAFIEKYGTEEGDAKFEQFLREKPES